MINKKLIALFFALIMVASIGMVLFSNSGNSVNNDIINATDTSSGNSSLPVYIYNITLTNPTKLQNGSYQQLFTINNYTLYGINSNVSNFYISLMNGTYVYTWIQSYNSTSLTFWSKVPYGTTKLYMHVFSVSTDLLSSTGYLGYGTAYFNAPNVFLYAIDNFSLSYLHSNGWVNGTARPAWIYYDTPINTSVAVDLYANFGNNTEEVGPAIANSAFNNFVNIASYHNYIVVGNQSITDIGNIVTTSYGNRLYTLASTNPTTFFGQANYENTVSYTGQPSFSPMYAGLYDLSYFTSLGWLNIRTLPSASATMPTISISGYNITFIETGLISGTSWSLTFNSVSYNSSSNLITVSNITYGVYSYYASSTGFINLNGSVTVNGSNQIVSLTFTKTKYKVTFTETGLISGTSWLLTFNSVSYSSSSNLITVSNITNGTYKYTAYSNYYNNVTGYITLNGNNLSENILFTEKNYYMSIIVSKPSTLSYEVLIIENNKMTYYNTTSSYIEVNYNISSLPLHIDFEPVNGYSFTFETINYSGDPANITEYEYINNVTQNYNYIFEKYSYVIVIGILFVVFAVIGLAVKYRN